MLSIDEFVQLMTGGEDMSEMLSGDKNFAKLQQSYQQTSFNFAEILSQFNLMPESFVPSFFFENKIKPSSSLKV